MKRKIVLINEEKCDGCGLCVPACHEGAIEIIDGKARLLEDRLCDGIGDCLGECPLGAISIIEREADEFDEEAVKIRLEHLKAKDLKEKHNTTMTGGCPGSRAMSLTKSNNTTSTPNNDEVTIQSELTQWPVQLTLVPPMAPYFRESDILIAADCVPLAYADFHRKMLKGKAVAIGCPKLDDGSSYVNKLAQIIKFNDIKSLTVAHMEVPCCFGLIQIVKRAIQESGVDIEPQIINIGVDGTIK